MENKGKNAVLQITSGGKMKITDNALFLKLMMGEEVDGTSPAEAYSFLYTYAKKQMQKFYADIPYQDHQYIINMAIAKAVKDFEEGKASFLPFFFSKLKGEVHIYKTKRASLHKKIVKIFENPEDGTDYLRTVDKERSESTLILSNTESIEDQMLQDDYYKRQTKAFKMAFSGLPRLLQIILYEIGSGVKAQELSLLLGIDEAELKKKKNYALSLLLQRVLRSKHLSEDEKKEILSIHNIEPEQDESTI